jgi:hypothetical protein
MRSAWFNSFKQEPWEPGHYVTRADGTAGELMRHWDGFVWMPPVRNDCAVRWCGLVAPPPFPRSRVQVVNSGRALRGQAAASVNAVGQTARGRTESKELDANAGWPFPR